MAVTELADRIDELEDENAALHAEIKRLREGIEAHRHGIAGDGFEQRLERNRRLWALLDEDERVLSDDGGAP